MMGDGHCMLHPPSLRVCFCIPSFFFFLPFLAATYLLFSCPWHGGGGGPGGGGPAMPAVGWKGAGRRQLGPGNYPNLRYTGSLAELPGGS